MSGWARLRRIDSITQAVGDTPLVPLRSVTEHTPAVTVLLKLEYLNPSGSIKDRGVLRIFRDARQTGVLSGDTILLDATGPNTGLSYALFGAALGVRVRLVMPDSVAEDVRLTIADLGADVIATPASAGFEGARAVAEERAKEPGVFYARYHTNPSNLAAHYDGTSREILRDVGDRITHVVVGLGSGGTWSGTHKRLRELRRPVSCIGVRLDATMVGFEGLAGGLPTPQFSWEADAAGDDHDTVSVEEAFAMTARLAGTEGLFVGPSSGATICTAIRLAERLQQAQKSGCIVAIVGDRGDRYAA